MSIIFIVILSLLLISSVIINVLLWKAGTRQLTINEIYTNWISDWREQVFKIWAHMKMLDDKQMFEKDDDVGIVFQDMKLLIKSLNDITEETTESEEDEK